VSQWDCDAYGPDGRELGALCFMAGGPGKRTCASQDACREAMGAERRRVFRRINEMAAEGNPVGEYLAEEFTDPSQILGGGE
jgi:hypothetical protein